MYIYEMPYAERRELCYILDQNAQWKELGAVYMKYDAITLDSLGKNMTSSPSDELLNLWSLHNHTVIELFVLLSQMKFYSAMNVIKNLVDPKYHRWIKNDQDRVNNSLKALDINKAEKKYLNAAYSKVNEENFNRDSEKVIKGPEIIFCPTVVTRDDNNESVENNVNKNNNNKQKMISANDISFVVESARGIPSIPYEDLQKSTNNWSDENILGKGGFGKVFKGTWKCTGVAIKRLEIKDGKPEYETEQIKQSITELNCLNSYRHDNILPLYGYSIGGPHPCLIYQYMPGGSLDQRLLRVRDPAKVLNWPTRLNIAIGTARGLQFLHTNMIKDKPLIHGDIKSANILLDSRDEAKIGDFGLAREGPQSQYTYIKLSRIQGTRPYLPEEFLRGNKFSTKVDTYSFGVVLFEIATALAPYSDKREDKFLKDHIMNYEGDVMELKDKKMQGNDDYFKGILEIGKMCVRQQAKERPEMVSVLIALEDVRDGKCIDINKKCR